MTGSGRGVGAIARFWSVSGKTAIGRSEALIYLDFARSVMMADPLLVILGLVLRIHTLGVDQRRTSGKP